MPAAANNSHIDYDKLALSIDNQSLPIDYQQLARSVTQELGPVFYQATKALPTPNLNLSELRERQNKLTLNGNRADL
ncbi:hypothetical protein [Hymenobacter cellulosilyticus]|uniref:Uncharacterized protein n=1 Tax=Hymenobacter cellulosilyticus TaxID=2932248 RepID=A0A8T9Q234_9BACT|nr:hypothetical protein [Hymenobacter cellulosilyticus]UOQ70982.1 hypothetical protein MUN79_20235 [Hymenobacter cellulosilyticus]